MPANKNVHRPSFLTGLPALLLACPIVLAFGSHPVIGKTNSATEVSKTVSRGATLTAITTALGAGSWVTNGPSLDRLKATVQANPLRFPDGVRNGDRFLTYPIVNDHRVSVFQIRGDVWVNSTDYGTPLISLDVPYDPYTLDKAEFVAVVVNQTFRGGWRFSLTTNYIAVIQESGVSKTYSLDVARRRAFEAAMKALHGISVESVYGHGVIDGSEINVSFRNSSNGVVNTTVFLPDGFIVDPLTDGGGWACLKNLWELVNRVRETAHWNTVVGLH